MTDFDNDFFGMEKRVQRVGKFDLEMDSHGLYKATSVHGEPLPDSLAGHWVSPGDFRAAHDRLYPPEPDAVADLWNPKMGGYPNAATENATWQREKRAAIRSEVGPYTLTLDPDYNLYTAERTEGGTVPPGLRGKWSDVATFRHRVSVVDSGQSKPIPPAGPREPDPTLTTEPASVEPNETISDVWERLPGKVKGLAK